MGLDAHSSAPQLTSQLLPPKDEGLLVNTYWANDGFGAFASEGMLRERSRRVTAVPYLGFVMRRRRQTAFC